MRPYITSAFLGGLRGRSIHGVFLLGFALLAFSYVAADFSPRQPQTVALDFGLSLLRFILVLLAIFWVQELIGKEFERKTVLFLFAYPADRRIYLVGRFLGVVLLLAVATVILGLFLWAVTLYSDHGYSQAQPVALGVAFVVALLGVLVDVCVVAAFALMIATLSTVNLLPLALGGIFAVAGRSLGPVLDYVRQGADGDKAMVERFSPILETVQWLLPDLSRLDWRAWPLYQLVPDPAAVAWSLLMAAAYIAVMLTLAVMVCRRREVV